MTRTNRREGDPRTSLALLGDAYSAALEACETPAQRQRELTWQLRHHAAADAADRADYDAYVAEVRTARRKDFTPVPEGAVLHLVTGTFGDQRKPAVTLSMRRPAADASPDDWKLWRDERDKIEPLRAMAEYAFERRDAWSSEETREYWVAHLGSWPATGVAANQDALAFNVAYARTLGLEESEAVALCGLGVRDPRKADVVARADRMLRDLQGPADCYLPRVVTEEELHTADFSVLGGNQTLSPREQARWTDPVKPHALDKVLDQLSGIHAAVDSRG